MNRLPINYANWKDLKRLTWEKFPSQQIYIDEEKQIFVMKRKNGVIVTIGYGCTEQRGLDSDYELMQMFGSILPDKLIDGKIDLNNPRDIPTRKLKGFISVIREVGHKYSEHPYLILILNYELFRNNKEDLEKFPSDFKYYFFDGSLIPQDIAESIKKSKPAKRWTVVDVKETKIKFIEDEGTIMDALNKGLGDNIGF